jgi:hypothetical protein
MNNKASYFCETADLSRQATSSSARARQAGGALPWAHDALILRNHGIVATGHHSGAVWIAVKLSACRVQLLAEWAGGQIRRRRRIWKTKQARPSRRSFRMCSLPGRSWCRLHGKADDPCCAEHYETDTSGYKG